MYAFESTNDFGHKTGYVADITTCADLLIQRPGPDSFYPLERPIEFDNLFERFQYEINASISSGIDFDSGLLFIARMYYMGRTQQLSNNYCVVQLKVVNNDQTIRIYYGLASSRTATLSRYYACSFADYQGGTHAYNKGRIYLLRFRSPDQQSIATLLDTWYAILMVGDIAGYIGTYQEPSSSYPNGRMFYTFSAYTLPSLIQTGTIEQNGFPTAGTGAAERRAAQPELVGVCPIAAYYPGNVGSDKAMFVSSSGEYDPDPTPPTPPGPGPTPSSDPNYDPNVEPGDNPDPTPGPHNRQYDPIPIPGLPSVTAIGAGFTTLYRPSEAILKLLASELYSDNAIQIISNFFSDPYDMIAGLSIVPFMVPVSGRAKHRIGLFESDITMDVVSNQFVTVNCGDILIEPYYNSFLDHSPYTRLILWLPYIGYQEIDPDEIMGQMLNITYHCDCLSGACTAFVNSGVVGETGPQIPRVIAQFSGNCSVQIPTAATSYDNLIASSINILTTAVSAGVGQVSAAASMATMQGDSYTQEDLDAVHAKSAVSGGQSLIGCAGDVVRAMKPTVTRNGTPGSSAGYMGVQTPYLIKIVPRNSIPDDSAFMTIKGYPSNKTGTLSEYSGFCVVEDIQLNNVPATIGEINEIYDLLKGGVIL